MLFTFSSSDFSFTGGFCKAAAKADALSFFAKKLETRTPLASTSLSSDIIRFNLTEESAWKICSCETNPKLNKQTLCLRQNRRCRCFGEKIILFQPCLEAVQMAGNFFRGTSVEQDGRWGKSDEKLMAKMAKNGMFAPILETKVNLKKINLDVINRWVTQKIIEVVGFEDDILINLVINMLQGADVDGKKMQLDVTGFLEKQSGAFVAELWALMVDAQEQPTGIPSVFLQKKKEEILQRQSASNRFGPTLGAEGAPGVASAAGALQVRSDSAVATDNNTSTYSSRDGPSRDAKKDEESRKRDRSRSPERRDRRDRDGERADRHRDHSHDRKDRSPDRRDRDRKSHRDDRDRHDSRTERDDRRRDGYSDRSRDSRDRHDRKERHDRDDRRSDRDDRREERSDRHRGDRHDRDRSPERRRESHRDRDSRRSPDRSDRSDRRKSRSPERHRTHRDDSRDRRHRHRSPQRDRHSRSRSPDRRKSKRSASKDRDEARAEPEKTSSKDNSGERDDNRDEQSDGDRDLEKSGKWTKTNNVDEADDISVVGEDRGGIVIEE